MIRLSLAAYVLQPSRYLFHAHVTFVTNRFQSIPGKTRTVDLVLQPGETAPSFTLAEATGEGDVTDPWKDGPVVLAFFKTTCPVCQMAAPAVQALADGGARVVAVGEDPPDQLRVYADRYQQKVTTVTEPPPYAVSSAYGLETVPSLVLVGDDGVVRAAVESWDRTGWNRVAEAAGAGTVSHPSDGLPPFRPG